jgi:oxalate decarboxylase/phosphoglucose isomerase-like protein (cupin superfamily)
MSEQSKREVVTIDGVQVTLNLAESPVKNLGVTTGAELFQLVNILDPKYQPENYNKADGSPLRLFDSAPVKIDLSKRSREDMGFWHRNVDYHEVIICFRGALRWETEIKTVTLRAGEIMIIPKGITHRSMLCEESEAENILIELKVTDALAYVGEKK